jgi:hypothetical protein
VYNFLGDFQKALDCYKQALEINKAMHANADHLDIVNSFNCIGFTYKNMAEVKTKP